MIPPLVAYSGSREYPDLRAVHADVAALPREAVIVVGGWWSTGSVLRAYPTRGVDLAAAVAGAQDHTVVLVIGPYGAGNGAGILRNPITVAIGDELRAFAAQCHQPGCARRPHPTHGTERTIGHAREQGKTVRLYGPDGKAVA